MRADEDVVGFALAHCFLHYEGVAAVETAGYIGDVNEREELLVWTAFQIAVAFAEVNVDEGLAF